MNNELVGIGVDCVEARATQFMPQDLRYSTYVVPCMNKKLGICPYRWSKVEREGGQAPIV
jgi:hypothetical protein